MQRLAALVFLAAVVHGALEQNYVVELTECVALRSERGTTHPHYHRQVVLEVSPATVRVSAHFCDIRPNHYCQHATHFVLARRITPDMASHDTDSAIDLFSPVYCHTHSIRDTRPWHEAVQLIGPTAKGKFDSQHKCYTLEKGITVANPYPDIEDPHEWGGYLAFLVDRNALPSADNLRMGHCLCVQRVTMSE